MAYRQALLRQMNSGMGSRRREDDPTLDPPEDRPLPGGGGGGGGPLDPSPAPPGSQPPAPPDSPLPPSAPPPTGPDRGGTAPPPPPPMPGGGVPPSQPQFPIPGPSPFPGTGGATPYPFPPTPGTPPLTPTTAGGQPPLVPGGSDTGPGGITGRPPTGTAPIDRAGQTPGGGANSPWLTGDPVRDPVRQYVLDVLAKNGKQPTGAGSGPTDLEYYVDRILAEGGLSSGYDWAGRIERGLNGTQPAESGGGQSQGGQFGNIPPQLAEYYRMLTEQIRRQQEQQAGVDGAMRDALLRMMAQGQEPVDVSKGNLGSAAEAYRNAQHREMNQSRAALAERAASAGLNAGGAGSGAFDTSLMGLDEQSRQNISGNEANLALGEVQQRRQMLVQALQIAQALGARTEANALQGQLAQMDSLMRMYSLQQQQGQFEDSQVFDWARLQAEMNRQALLDG